MAPEKAPLRVVLCFYPDQPQDDIALGLAQRAWPSAFLRFPTVHRLEPEGRLRVVLPGVATPSGNDGVDGAPNGISVPRWSLSKPHLKGSRPWASLSGICRLSRGLVSIWRRF